MPERDNVGSSYASHDSRLADVLKANKPWGGDSKETGCWPPDKHNAALLDAVAPLWTNPTPPANGVFYYDLVSIGAGAGGLVSAKQSSRRGFKSALIEKHLAGGDCLNVGCVPSKALLRAAKAAKHGTIVPFSDVMERLRVARAKIAPADAASTTSSVGCAVFRGTAVFTGPNSLSIVPSSDCQVHAEIKIVFGKCVIAVGGVAAIPPQIAGLSTVPYHTNATLYNITALPPRVVVMGGGPIGLEMAQALSLLGSEVTVVLRGAAPLPKEDPDAAAAVQKSLEMDGVTFMSRVKVSNVRVKQNKQGWTPERPCHDDKYPEIGLVHEGGEILCDLLLIATGRRANTGNLGLEKAGVKVDEKKGGLVVVDDWMRSVGNEDVFAVGDCASTLQFTHMAGTQAQMVVDNALFGGDRRVSKMVVPWCTFTSPEVAHVGEYAHEHEEGKFDTYTSELRGNDRAICDEEDGEGGFVKVHCRKGTEEIVGGTIVASHAGEMISELTIAIQFGIPLGQNGIGGVIHPYPTVSDAVGGCGFGCKTGRWARVEDGGDSKAPVERGGKDRREIVKATHAVMGGEEDAMLHKGFFAGVVFGVAMFVGVSHVLSKKAGR